MPANLSPAYRAAEETYRRAVTKEEKLSALEEMLRIMPKHKGTDKLQAEVKSKIARLKREPKKSATARLPGHHVPREGAGQVVLVGPPNAGKSSLVRHLTHASPEVADYPFTTRQAIPGMMPFENIAFQLVDLPPICDEHVEPWVYDLIRTADLAWLVLDTESSLEGLECCRRLLATKAIELELSGELDSAQRRPGWCYRKSILVLTGIDRPAAREDLSLLPRLLEIPWTGIGVSSLTGEGLTELGRRTFEDLDIQRVYSKQPGKAADLKEPFTLPLGATVGDLAAAIHQDLRCQFKFARVWGKSAFDGQKVQLNHVLEEGDVVEIHL